MRIDQLKLLWVDMTVSQLQAAVPAAVTQGCRVSRASRMQSIDRHFLHGAPDAVFFDFDYPDQAGLGIAASLKQSRPETPVVMLTVQHSEALAVWAFRSRFLDYLVKPVPQEELDRCLALLDEVCSEKRGQANRRQAAAPLPAPEDMPTPTSATIALLPAVYFVEKNFHMKISSDEVARLCAMSPFRFGRAFKDAFDVTFREYVVRVRLREANRLLRNPQAIVSEVAYAVGFNDMSYFSRMFKRHFGVVPSSVQVAPAPLPEGENRLMDMPPLLVDQTRRLN